VASAGLRSRDALLGSRVAVPFPERRIHVPGTFPWHLSWEFGMRNNLVVVISVVLVWLVGAAPQVAAELILPSWVTEVEIPGGATLPVVAFAEMERFDLDSRLVPFSEVDACGSTETRRSWRRPGLEHLGTTGGMPGWAVRETPAGFLIVAPYWISSFHAPESCSVLDVTIGLVDVSSGVRLAEKTLKIGIDWDLSRDDKAVLAEVRTACAQEKCAAPDPVKRILALHTRLRIRAADALQKSHGDQIGSRVEVGRRAYLETEERFSNSLYYSFGRRGERCLVTIDDLRNLVECDRRTPAECKGRFIGNRTQIEQFLGVENYRNLCGAAAWSVFGVAEELFSEEGLVAGDREKGELDDGDRLWMSSISLFAER
jgi:hypothetical protein